LLKVPFKIKWIQTNFWIDKKVVHKKKEKGPKSKIVNKQKNEPHFKRLGLGHSFGDRHEKWKEKRSNTKIELTFFLEETQSKTMSFDLVLSSEQRDQPEQRGPELMCRALKELGLDHSFTLLGLGFGVRQKKEMKRKKSKTFF